MSSISSVLASGSVTAAYGSDGIREIEEETTDDDDVDDTSIMMYSPLMPTPASLVSIAESEISVVAVHEESEDEEETEPVQYTPPPPAPEPHPPEQTQTSSWGIKLWPFSSWFSSSSQNANSTPANSNQVEPPAATPRAQRSVVPVSRPTSTQVRLRRRRVWVPSRTQLSLETMWWGYRIYIPPPILEALDSTSLETTRRAALLTAALTWFFTNFPVHVLPITVRPVIILLQGLVPYLGYLGSILSWSWGSIRSYDEGYGIILTATWLVPIALIPSTWVPPPSEWPGSPLSSQTTPTFSTLSSISHSTSPTLSQSTMTPTPMPPSSLPSSPSLLPQQELSPEPPQGQLYPIYSPAFVYQSPYSPASSLPLTQQYTQEPLDQAQQQGQPYPVYSPYSQTTMLSPLTQLSASFPSPPMNFSSFGYAYGHPFPTTSQTPPIMAMSMTSPIQTNGAVMFPPAMMPMSVTSSSSSSPYTSSSAALTPTPAPASALPITSTSSMSQRRSRKREGSLYAPRMATVPLPTEDR
ncbi:hypothetical protein F5887DRAFT_165428 [Amanita rubescens]|nr:hypothetical protein F5887DRAFT_165428 [Amanita rubescens]